MTDTELELQLDRATRVERRITKRVLRLICLADERKLYAKRGFPNLHKWLVDRFHYSDSAANRRIQAARVLRAVPEVEQKLTSGEVNLSTLRLAQSLMRKQERASGVRLDAQAKAEVVEKIGNKSQRECEKALFGLFPQLAVTTVEREVRVDENSVRVTSVFADRDMQYIERVKEVLSHSVPSGNFTEIVNYLVQYFLKKNPTAVNRCVKSCEFQDSVSGRVCGSRRWVEKDHIIPVALGGSDAPENLRWLCRTHNQLMSEKILGPKKQNQNSQLRRFQLMVANRVDKARAEFLKHRSAEQSIRDREINHQTSHVH